MERHISRFFFKSSGFQNIQLFQNTGYNLFVSNLQIFLVIHCYVSYVENFHDFRVALVTTLIGSVTQFCCAVQAFANHHAFLPQSTDPESPIFAFLTRQLFNRFLGRFFVKECTSQNLCIGTATMLCDAGLVIDANRRLEWRANFTYWTIFDRRLPWV